MYREDACASRGCLHSAMIFAFCEDNDALRECVCADTLLPPKKGIRIACLFHLHRKHVRIVCNTHEKVFPLPAPYQVIPPTPQARLVCNVMQTHPVEPRLMSEMTNVDWRRLSLQPGVVNTCATPLLANIRPSQGVVYLPASDASSFPPPPQTVVTTGGVVTGDSLSGSGSQSVSEGASVVGMGGVGGGGKRAKLSGRVV